MRVRDHYAEHMLSLNMEDAKAGSAKFDRLIADIFGREKIERWTRSFEAAARLFDQEFGREKGDYSRQALANSCNGIGWDVSNGPTEEYYYASGETDALALCAAMVMAKRKENQHRR